MSELGRQGEYAIFGCSRSAGTPSRSMLLTCERLQSPTLICSAASAKVKFQGRPVARRENRHRLLWVESSSSRIETAVVQEVRTLVLVRKVGSTLKAAIPSRTPSAPGGQLCRRHRTFMTRWRPAPTAAYLLFAALMATGSSGSSTDGHDRQLTSTQISAPPTGKRGQIERILQHLGLPPRAPVRGEFAA